MTEVLYLVVHNLGGVSGPHKVKWDVGLREYYDEYGDFSTDGVDTFSYQISRKHFTDKSEAKAFVSGIKWFLESQSRRYLENLEWL